jgi:ATP phosphoribosyltransferase regulatory subunit
LFALASLSFAYEQKSAILAPWIEDADLANVIAQLRNSGEVVIQVMAGDKVESAEYYCDRELIQQNKTWVVVRKSAT